MLALEAVNFSQTFDAAGRGDLRIVDITDPRAPAEIGNWALREIGLTNQFTGTGCFARTFGHSASATADGKGNFSGVKVKPFAGDPPGLHKICASVPPTPCAQFELQGSPTPTPSVLWPLTPMNVWLIPWTPRPEMLSP